MRIAGRSFGEVIIIVLVVLISWGTDERDRTGKIIGVWVPVCVPRWQFMNFERGLQVV